MRSSRAGEPGAGRRHPGSTGNSGSPRTSIDRLARYGLRRWSRSWGTNHRSAHRSPTWGAGTHLWLRGRGCTASYRRADRRTGHGGGPGFRPCGSTRTSRNGTAHRCGFRNGLNWMSRTAGWFGLRGTGQRGHHTSNGRGRLSRFWRRLDYLGYRSRWHSGRLGSLLGGSGRLGRSNWWRGF